MSGSGEDGALVVYENLQPARNWKRIPGTLAPVPLVHGARGIGHPLNQLLWRRQEGQQMREDLLRSLDEEAVADAFWLVQRDGQRLGLCLPAKFVRWIPVRHPGIERIQDDVAAMFVVELLHKLARRIVDDGDIAACIDLIEHLADDARFARAGVSNDEEVLVLGIARNA